MTPENQFARNEAAVATLVEIISVKPSGRARNGRIADKPT